MKKKTLYSKEVNENFAKSNNFKEDMKYIQLLSNKDKNGKNEFTLWFYGSYFYQDFSEWKGQSYYTNVEGFIKSDMLVLDNEFKFT